MNDGFNETVLQQLLHSDPRQGAASPLSGFLMGLIRTRWAAAGPLKTNSESTDGHADELKLNM